MLDSPPDSWEPHSKLAKVPGANLTLQRSDEGVWSCPNKYITALINNGLISLMEVEAAEEAAVAKEWNHVDFAREIVVGAIVSCSRSRVRAQGSVTDGRVHRHGAVAVYLARVPGVALRRQHADEQRTSLWLAHVIVAVALDDEAVVEQEARVALRAVAVENLRAAVERLHGDDEEGAFGAAGCG